MDVLERQADEAATAGNFKQALALLEQAAAEPGCGAALLGMLSLKHGKSIEWDGEKERIIGDDVANKLLRRDYRKGWEYPKA